MTEFSPLWISLKTAGLATIATFLLGTLAAYAMTNYRGRWKALIESILIAPLVLPPTVVGFLLLIVLGKNGWLGRILSFWDISIIFTWYAAVMAAVVVSFPLMYKTALGAFEQVDTSLLQVARTLGASEYRIAIQVILPLAMPGLLAGVTLSFARALGEFGATLMVAGNIPGQTQTMPMAIYFAVEAGDQQEAWLWAIAIMSLSLSALGIVNGWQKRRKQSPLFIGAVEANEPITRGGKRTVPSHLGEWVKPTLPDLSSGLIVDIEKKLSKFTLEIGFTATTGNLGILGGSGSGKSMTLRCISGIDTPTKGRVILNGRSLFDSEQQINLPSYQRKVGLVLQNYALFPHLTVAQNIAFGLQKYSAEVQNQRVAQQITALQLEGFEHHHPHQLSGGQQQRVALARALATEPDLLLLDEPFSALDTHLRQQMERQLIETLSTYDGITLFVTHNLEEAYRICNTLMVMSEGRAIAHDSKYHIFEHPRTVRVAQLTGCKNFSRAVAHASDRLEALDWGITLKTVEAHPENLTDVGIRAHQLKVTLSATEHNSFPCWLAQTSETPHRMTLFLKFNCAPLNLCDYHIQAELFKDQWQQIKDQPLPWYVTLQPERLILMIDG